VDRRECCAGSHPYGPVSQSFVPKSVPKLWGSGLLVATLDLSAGSEPMTAAVLRGLTSKLPPHVPSRTSADNTRLRQVAAASHQMNHSSRWGRPLGQIDGLLRERSRAGRGNRAATDPVRKIPARRRTW
jgi:hypothetical protein